MKMNKEKFLKTELGGNLKDCITVWDKSLDMRCKHLCGTEEHKKWKKAAERCQAQWEVYKIAIQQFYGIEYNFTRNDGYYGLVTTDETDWLFKIEKQGERS